MAKEMIEINGSELELNLHLGQIKAFDSEKRFVFVIAGTQGGKCGRFSVLLSNGQRCFVKNLSVGDEVCSLGQDLRIHKTRISAVFKTGKQQLFKVTTRMGREITVTANHPFLGRDGWLPCKDFKEGDFIAVPRILPDVGTEHADSKKMKLLGYLIGDGGLTSSSLMFSNVDSTILADLKSSLPPSCALVHSDRCTYRIKRKWKGSFNPVLDLVRRCNLDTLSKYKRIPLFVFRLATADIAPLLNGLFATDGWIDTKGIGLASASKGLIQDVAHLLLRFGINARFRYKPSKFNGQVFDSWDLTINDPLDLKVFAQRIGITSKQNKLLNLIKKKEGKRDNTKDVIPNFPLRECYNLIFEPGKHGRWNEAQDTIGYKLLRSSRRKNISRSFAQKIANHFNIGLNEAHSDIYWDKVKSIANLGVDETYDIEVEGHEHNFIADDFFAHNTSFGPWWLYREIQRCGDGDYLAVTANYDLFKLKMLPEMRKVFEDILHIGRFWAAERIIEIRNPFTNLFEAENASDHMWARIILRSAKAGTKKTSSGAGSLESATAKASWIDECGLDDFSLQAWEAVLRRLSLSQGRVLGTTTLYNLGWMKHEVYDRWERGDPDFDVISFESIQNPAFPKAEFERARRSMPAWKFNMLYRGQYDRPAGMIYPDFDSSIHVVEPFQIPLEWPRYTGIDPGPVHFATVWLAADVRQRAVFVYRETLEGNLTSQQHAEKARQRAANERVTWCGGSKSELQFRQDWKAFCCIDVLEPPVHDVETGIDRVLQLLKEKRLFFFSTCRGILDEIGTYTRKLDPNGEPVEEIKDKEKYHRLDALRYAVLSYLKPPSQPIEFILPRVH